MTFLLFSPFFLCLLISSLLLGLTSTSWLLFWMALELNLMAFIPMLNTPISSHAMMKYFLIQSLGSILMIVPIVIFLFSLTSSLLLLLPIFGLIMKLGCPPIFMWLPQVAKDISFKNNWLLLTIQKLLPMNGLMMLLNPTSKLWLMIMILSLLVGSLGGFSQTFFKQLLAFSSISHLGWLLGAMIVSVNLFLTYFMFYSIILLSIIVTLKLNNISKPLSSLNLMTLNPSTLLVILILMLNLGGMPPLLGFLPKMMVLNMLFYSLMLSSIMIFSSAMNLFFYMFNFLPTPLKLSYSYTQQKLTFMIILFITPLPIIMM